MVHSRERGHLVKEQSQFELQWNPEILKGKEVSNSATEVTMDTAEAIQWLRTQEG